MLSTRESLVQRLTRHLGGSTRQLPDAPHSYGAVEVTSSPPGNRGGLLGSNRAALIRSQDFVVSPDSIVSPTDLH